METRLGVSGEKSVCNHLQQLADMPLGNVFLFKNAGFECFRLVTSLCKQKKRGHTRHASDSLCVPFWIERNRLETQFLQISLVSLCLKIPAMIIEKNIR